MLLAPEPHERVLHDVLGVRQLPDKLAGEEDEPGCQFRETNFPIFMSDDIFHDLFYGLLITRRRQLMFLSSRFVWRAQAASLHFSAACEKTV